MVTAKEELKRVKKPTKMPSTGNSKAGEGPAAKKLREKKRTRTGGKGGY